MTKGAIIEDFARYVSPGKVTVYRSLGFDFVPGRREGCRIWDLDGSRSFINCRSSGGVFNLGHRPPRVIAALREALGQLDVGDHILMSAARAALAKRLAELTPGDIQYTFFTPGGGEAIDVAIKLARGYSGRPGIISAEKGYHGHTGFALAAGDTAFKHYFEPLAPGFRQVPFGDLEALEQAMDEQTAAVLFETIPATAGIVFPPTDFYPTVRDICDRHGALLMLDEVQAGLGRTGKLWGIDHWGVVPDILVLGKGMSGGIYPLSVVCYREKLDAFFQEHPFIHLSSFGGAELGCVAALAMLDQITEPGFLEHVNQMGKRFADGFQRLKAKYPLLVAGWRQLGLMIGFDLAEESMGPMMTYALGHHGVLAIFADFSRRTMQILPPLIIQPQEVDEVLAAMDGALDMVAEMVAAGMPAPGIP